MVGDPPPPPRARADQDTRLGRHDYTDIGSLAAMPQLQHYLIEGGARMRNAFVNTPICCPSRTEFFSGRYYHNIGPPNDPGSCMHVDTSNVGKNTTGLFGLLKQANCKFERNREYCCLLLPYNFANTLVSLFPFCPAYADEVGVFGKVTNDASAVLALLSAQESASWINSPLNFNNFDGTTYWRDNGTNSAYTENIDKTNPVYGTTYQTTQIGNRTLDWLNALHERRQHAAATGDGEGATKPFFAYLGPHAPHYPAQPAPWYEHAFDDVSIPITPNYNLSCPDKTQHIRQNPPLSAQVKCWQNQHFRDRWASLLSVDDIVGAIVNKLEAQGVLDKTFIFYSSDRACMVACLRACVQGSFLIPTLAPHPHVYRCFAG